MIIYLCLSLQVVKEVILPFLLCCCCFKYSSRKERLNREGMFSRLAGLGWHASSENQNDNICMSHMSSGWCCWKKDSFLSEQRPGMRSVPQACPMVTVRAMAAVDVDWTANRKGGGQWCFCKLLFGGRKRSSCSLCETVFIPNEIQ